MTRTGVLQEIHACADTGRLCNGAHRRGLCLATRCHLACGRPPRCTLTPPRRHSPRAAKSPTRRSGMRSAVGSRALVFVHLSALSSAYDCQRPSPGLTRRRSGVACLGAALAALVGTAADGVLTSQMVSITRNCLATRPSRVSAILGRRLLQHPNQSLTRNACRWWVLMDRTSSCAAHRGRTRGCHRFAE